MYTSVLKVEPQLQHDHATCIGLLLCSAIGHLAIQWSPSNKDTPSAKQFCPY